MTSRDNLFSDQQLVLIADWKVADDRMKSVDVLRDVAVPVVQALNSSGRWTACVSGESDAGYTNFETILMHRKLERHELSRARHHVPFTGIGFEALLSTCVPYGVLVREQFTVTSSPARAGGAPTLDNILPPRKGMHEEVDALLEAFEGSLFEFLTREELSQPLPPGVVPYEYCLCDEPWNLVFHAMFARTD